MAYDTPPIEKSITKIIDITVSLYVLPEVIVEGIYYNSIKSNINQEMILKYI